VWSRVGSAGTGFARPAKARWDEGKRRGAEPKTRSSPWDGVSRERSVQANTLASFARHKVGANKISLRDEEKRRGHTHQVWVYWTWCRRREGVSRNGSLSLGPSKGCVDRAVGLVWTRTWCGRQKRLGSGWLAAFRGAWVEEAFPCHAGIHFRRVVDLDVVV